MAGPSLVAVPGKPGQYYNEATGKTSILTEVREDAFVDTVEFTSGAQSAGTGSAQGDPFSNVTNKKLVDSNITTARRIPANNKFLLSRIAVHVRQVNGNTVTDGRDIVKMYEAATLSFSLNKRLITDGPLFKYQSGYGVQGTINNSATLGVPSSAAAPKLARPQPVSEDDDLNCTLTVENRAWLNASTRLPTFAGNVLVFVALYGEIEKPLGT